MFIYMLPKISGIGLKFQQKYALISSQNASGHDHTNGSHLTCSSGDVQWPCNMSTFARRPYIKSLQYIPWNMHTVLLCSVLLWWHYQFLWIIDTFTHIFRVELLSMGNHINQKRRSSFHNRKQEKTICMFYGIYCKCEPWLVCQKQVSSVGEVITSHKICGM